MKSGKIVENRAIPIRRVTRPSGAYFQRAERWWHIAAVSLPVDALLLLLLPSGAIPLLINGLTNRLMIGLGVLALAGLFRDSAIELLEALWSKRGKVLELRQRYGKPLIVVFTLLAAIEAVLHFGQFGWVVIAVVGVVSYRAFHELSKLLKESRAREERLDHDKIILLEQRNFQVFCIVVAPILAARAYVFVGAIVASQYALPEERWREYLTIFALGFIGLLALRPQSTEFITHCPRCSRPGSRVLSSFGGCPACSREDFVIGSNEAQPMSAERIFASNPPAPEPGTGPGDADETRTESVGMSLPRLARRLLDSLLSRSRSVERG